MANIASVAKRARQADKRRVRNAAYRAQLRTAKKRFSSLLAAKDEEGLRAAAPTLLQLLDKMVTKGIIHKNNAARNKSRSLAKVRAVLPDFDLPKITGGKVSAPQVAKVEVEEAPAKAASPKKAATTKKSTAKKATATKASAVKKPAAKKATKAKEDK